MIPKTEYVPYYTSFIELVDTSLSIEENLIKEQDNFEKELRNVEKEKQNYKYANDKWTIKELIQHLIDSERVFCYRALCFSRGDKTDLPGFDQDLFVVNSRAQDRDYDELLDEMQLLRKGTIQLFNSFTKEDLVKLGSGSGSIISVRALGMVMAGHQKHHLEVIKERYL